MSKISKPKDYTSSEDISLLPKKREVQIEDVFNAIDKKHGVGTVILGNNTPDNIPRICSTGSLLLDTAIGGGLPAGRMIEVFGAPSSGKSTLCLHMIREAQQKYPDAYVSILDFENSFDKNWAIKMGVDPNKLAFSQPDTADVGFDIMEQLVKSGKVKLIIVDSVDAMVPRAVLEGEYGDSHIGQLARIMSQGCRKLANILGGTDCCVVFINQTRMKIGVMYGNPETVSGGTALTFYSSLRLRVSRGEVIGQKEDPDGFETVVSVVKSKVSPPFRKIRTNLYLGKEGRFGIDKNAELFDLAVLGNIVSKSGTWFSYGNDRLGQGRENSVKAMVADEKMFAEIRSAVEKTVLNNGEVLDKAPEEEAAE